MSAVERVVLPIVPQVVHVGIEEILFLGDSQHGFSLCVVEEFTFAVEQFQCVPVAGVVRSGDDDASF